MEQHLNLFINTVFINNMIFAYFLGMCSFLAVSKTVKTAIGLGVAVVFVMIITIPVNYLLEKYLLKEGSLTWLSPKLSGVDLSFLSFIVFIAVIAAIVQLVEMVVERYSPSLYNALGIFLPLIAVDCAVLGGALFMQQREFSNVLETVTFSFGSGLGWAVAIVSLAAIREKMRYSNVPAPLRGLGITFILVGLMAMAFMGFMGFKL
jgi:Na+-transporting NADH:ubiquinone oxidoreductase subunit E